ncbi:hypothetical protein [Tissierella praeacuta]|uniref:Uncharacterized protein n=1 Tax=Tissierella praeacuta DSM 18095 TaxID=1123404 RepID=A0A1M4V8K9_9FIRM|nr:hypothetical protein [Tissierella praeacuta]SHE65294.1 hypothetical protein SAMN02745784_01408 [Tissierella praeacuta DSM 18095]SUP03031.1 Uncharacterised protein [Tissierella praeacuta]
MEDKEKLNQPYYTDDVSKKQSNLSNKKSAMDDLGFYSNSEVFPPRGSFINIPEDILFNSKGNSLNNITEDKNRTIGSDLYKETKK